MLNARTDLRSALAKLRKTLGENSAHDDAREDRGRRAKGAIPFGASGTPRVRA
jgi:hypothetical protein